jgi:hypothetical protein
LGRTQTSAIIRITWRKNCTGKSHPDYCSDITNTYCSRETQTIPFAMTQFKNITGKNTKLYSHVVRIQGKYRLLKFQAADFSAQHTINLQMCKV